MASASCKLLRTAVQLVVKDDGFNIPSEPAHRARVLAERYLEWCESDENKRDFQLFSEELVRNLEACFTSHLTAKARQERMWERYYKFRSSSEFVQGWNDHLSQVSGPGPSCPIIYQFVTDVIMEDMIKRHFPVITEEQQCQVTLDYEEHNAIRYIAGHVLRALETKTNRSSHPLKDELTLCLKELKDESNDVRHASEDWLHDIDRGGLVHVSDMTYMLFTAMEQALRPCLGNMERTSVLEVKEVSKTIQSEENVLFYWSIISVNWEEETAEVLLCMIVEHWITLRGVSTASALIEKYKQQSKKNVQKSKGVRKRLQTE